MIYFYLIALASTIAANISESGKLDSQAELNSWKVIGAGLGRSGTDSLKKALEILGFGPCYHMKEALRGHPCTTHHVNELWAAGGQISSETFRRKLSCFQSGVDIPVAAYYEELMTAYPEAKVLLSKRPSKEWALSASRTICPAAVARGAEFSTRRTTGTHDSIPWYVTILRAFLPVAPGTEVDSYRLMMSEIVRKIDRASVDTYDVYPIFQENSEARSSAYCSGDIDAMAQLYDKWNKRVVETVPKDRLIVFETGVDGWEKLCSALNVPVPTQQHVLENGTTVNLTVPYPHINTGSDYRRMVMAQKGLAVVLVSTPILVVVLLLLCVFKMCCVRKRGVGGSLFPPPQKNIARPHSD